MKIDIAREIHFRTARSGGKGGQNVNKVETMVEGIFPVDASALLNAHQKATIKEKLRNRITQDGAFVVRSQQHRSQLANKEEVIRKMNQLVNDALKKKKSRISTQPTAGSKEDRIRSKKKRSDIKSARQAVRISES
jgi:ribosome-associated protein